MMEIPNYILRNLELPCPPETNGVHYWILDEASKGGTKNNNSGECCKCHITKEEFFENSIIKDSKENLQLRFNEKRD